MRKFFKYLFRIILILLVIVMLLPFLLYAPFIQRYMTKKATEYVAEKLDMNLQVGNFSLKFPFQLELENVLLGKTAADTMVYAGRLHLEVGLSRILHQELSVRQFLLTGLKVNRKDSVSGMLLKIGLSDLEMAVPQVRLKTKEITVDSLELKGGHVVLIGAEREKTQDTVAVRPFGWTFRVEHLGIEEVSYRMCTSSLPDLAASVRRGQITEGKVDIGGQRVEVGEVNISEGECRIETAGSADKGMENNGQKQTDTTALWTVTAGVLTVDNYAFALVPERGEGMEWQLTDIGIRLDSVYNRGTEVRAVLKDLKLVRPQGGEIRSMQAHIDLEKEKTKAGAVVIRTGNSVIQLNAVAEGNVTEMIREVPLRISLDATVGMRDVAWVWPGMPADVRNKSLTLKADLAYEAGRADIRHLRVLMPGVFEVDGKGWGTSLQNLQRLSGEVKLKGELKDAAFLEVFTGDKLAVPSHIRFGIQAKAEEGKVIPHFLFCQNAGCLDLSGFWNIPQKSYQLHLQADSFPIGHFFPAGSLGEVTMEAELTGRGYRYGEAEAKLAGEITAFEYKQHVYRDVRLGMNIQRALLQGEIVSGDPDLDMDLKIKADSADRHWMVRLEGEVKRAGLKQLHFAARDFSIALELDIKAALQRGEKYDTHVILNRILLDAGKGTQQLGDLTLHMDSEKKHTGVRLASGDFYLFFEGDTLVTALAGQLGGMVREIGQQVVQRDFNMEQLRDSLPRFRLEMEGGMDNIIGKYLRARKIIFKEVKADITASPAKGLDLSVVAVRPVVDKIRFDSVELQVHQQETGLAYDLHVLNPEGIVKDLYDVRVSGMVAQNKLVVNFLQHNKGGENGIDIGAAVTLQDSSIMIQLSPDSPMLGYAPWTLNAGNKIILYKNHRIFADLSLTYENKLLSIKSSEGRNGQERLQVRLDGIDLAAISRSVPFVPDIEGILHTDVLLSLEENHLMAEGEVNVDSLYWQQKRIGDVGLDLSYDASDRYASHLVDFALHLDGLKRIVAKGAFFTSREKRDLKVNLDIPSLPLGLMNVFVPDKVVRLSGDIHGHLDIGGTIDLPDIEGGLAFRRSAVDVIVLGTHFRIDSTAIPVGKGIIEFRRFGLTAPNKQRLEIGGSVALVPFDRMGCDLTLTARNFQAVNVKENDVSLVYGKAYTDLQARLQGPFDALNLSGDIHLLNSTSLDYVLRNSAPELKDKAVDLVRFVSFGDTTAMVKDELTNRINTGSFTMKLLVEIGEAVSVTINLSEDGNNRVVIQGGGNLIYSLSPESGNNLVGKYMLTGGTVRYGIPVVGEKNFTIQNGSYVEWTGDLMNPLLHITAAESVRVSVTEDNQSSRIVNFEALIRIENSLERPQITFDLKALNDQAIQTQLAAFSQEERTKQAMNLLIYGTYSGPGTVNTGTNANNTLNNFVEKELNQWTRKYLKNSGLTFGIDSYNQIGADGQEVKRTDYSYQFSKQLFNDKINVKVGGRISSDNDPGSSMEQNLIDDISIEYMLTKKRDLFMKVFRHTNYESVLEGEVTQTGVGIVWRKSFRKVRDLFVRRHKRDVR